MRQNGLLETPEFALVRQRGISPLIQTSEDKTHGFIPEDELTPPSGTFIGHDRQ
jgi:hypothetical protein